MGRKRPRAASVDETAGFSKAKKGRFTLDSVPLPTIKTNGVVLVTGAGDVGQLGLGPDIMEKSRPALVPVEHEIVDVCAGGMHTVCLTANGEVITFGCNDEGALGRVAKDDDEFSPGLVELPSKAVQISAGDSHTVALLDDGRAFAWGTFRDSHGNMGLTKVGNKTLPYEIFSSQQVMKVASGADHIVFLTKHGEVFTCGCAEQGQLGRFTQRGCDRNARNTDLQLDKLLTPTIITMKASKRINFDNIWAGTYATFAKVAGKDDIFTFGLNNYYQIGLKSASSQHNPVLSKEFSKENWESICSGQHHTIALSKKGNVFVIGRKEYGRLGLGDVSEDATELTEVPFFKDKIVTTIGCGSSTSFAVTDDGNLYAWGMGSVGQLGTGEDEDCFEPKLIKSKQLVDKKVLRVQSGGQHTVILARSVENKTNGNDVGDSDKNGTPTE